MNINFIIINKKECINDFQAKLWNGAEAFAKNKVIKKLNSIASYLGDHPINILIDMRRGEASIIKDNLSEEQYINIKRALNTKAR